MKISSRVQKPEGLTTFSRLIGDYRINFGNKHLTPVWDGQIDPADCGQGHWLFQLCERGTKVATLPKNSLSSKKKLQPSVKKWE